MITIDNEVARTETQEGVKKQLPLDKFIEKITPPQLDLVLPNGVKMLVQGGNQFMVVYEMKPGVHRLTWPDGYEERNEYTLALPYVVLLIPLIYNKGKLLPHSSFVECYYRNAPITESDDKLFYPALLNSGYFRSVISQRSWLCTGRANWYTLEDITNNSRRLWKIVGLIKGNFFGAPFNHEWDTNWDKYCEWDQADSRIVSVNRWQSETKKDPSFILKVKWQPAELNLRETIDHTLSGLHQAYGVPLTHMERLILNQQS